MLSDVTTSQQTDAVALVRAQFAAMATGTRDDLARVVHPEATNREAVIEPPASRGRGPEAWWATALWLRHAYADLWWEIHEAIAAGDLVAVHATMSGRHTGTHHHYAPDGSVLRTFAPTGRAFAVTQSHWLRIADGLIIEHWANRDDLGLAVQLGWITPPGS
jgi:predicted ester cyclase